MTMMSDAIQTINNLLKLRKRLVHKRVIYENKNGKRKQTSKQKYTLNFSNLI